MQFVVKTCVNRFIIVKHLKIYMLLEYLMSENAINICINIINTNLLHDCLCDAHKLCSIINIYLHPFIHKAGSSELKLHVNAYLRSEQVQADPSERNQNEERRLLVLQCNYAIDTVEIGCTWHTASCWNVAH